MVLKVKEIEIFYFAVPARDSVFRDNSSRRAPVG